MTPTKGRKDSVTHDPHFCAMFKGHQAQWVPAAPQQGAALGVRLKYFDMEEAEETLGGLVTGGDCRLQSPIHLDLPRDRLLGIEAHWDKIPQGSSPNENLSFQLLSDTFDHPFFFPTYLLNSSLPSVLFCLASKWQGSTFLRHDIFHILPVMYKLPTACSS